MPDTQLAVFDSPVTAAFEVDQERRTIRGLAVPYGVSAESGGKRWQFSRGVFNYDDVSRVKVLISHDFSRAVGVVTALEETDDGLYMTARIAKGAAGDEALSMASEGVWDGLSVGLGTGGQYRLRSGVNHAEAGIPLQEISITPMPAFSSARITQVAASAEITNKENPMEKNETVEVEAVAGPDFSDHIAKALEDGFNRLAETHAKEVRPTVSAAPTFAVKEEAPYRFDGSNGSHDFSTDLFNGFRFGNGEARERVEKFIESAAAQFAVNAANVVEANPTVHRPDLYVDHAVYNTPCYSVLNRGAINDATPFVLPKYNSSGNLVADHVEAVEPVAGDFDLTSQTVTPTALSGRMSIPRGIVDAGGSPQVSALIWREMQRAYAQALETKSAALLAGGTFAALAAPAAGSADSVLVAAVEAGLADLQFAAGGNTFEHFLIQQDLYRALIAAKDSQGRKLLPLINPTNAAGSVTNKFGQVIVGGQVGTPAWSLGATSANAAKSYLIDPSAAGVWASAPKQLNWESGVANVNVGIYGYVASAILDASKIRVLSYDPVA